MKSKRPLLVILALYTGVLLALRAGWGLLSPRNGPDVPPGCADTSILRLANSSQDHVASIVERSCDATTDFVRSVYIASAGGRDPAAYEHPVLVTSGQGVATLHWQDARTLIVDYDPSATKFIQQQPNAGEFKILYRNVKRAAANLP